MAGLQAETDPAAQLIEAVLFVGSERTTPATLKPALPDVDDAVLARVAAVLNAKYERQSRPYRVEPDGDGWRMRLLPQYAAWVRERMRPDRGVKLGRPALEVLAAIAYKQPITRAAIEVLTSSDAGPPLRRLLRMKLVEQTAAEGDEPAQFRTTPRFLEAFRLTSPADLPVVEDR